ncbi:MAG: lysine--tRNA ligase [Patescibacteria group bacterium]|nr:lysine--tRNA ligase [Patescibacteria group bacterium]
MNNTNSSVNAISEVEERKNKINELKKINLNPYPSKAKRTHKIFEVIENFSNLEKNKENISLCGRLRSKRTHGNLSFANLEDVSGNIQIAISKKEVGADNYKILKNLIDVGDFLEVSGNCFLTHKGQQSIMVKSFKLLSKAIRPLPDKWHGLKNEEEKFRKRYLDLLMNPELRDMFRKKAKFWEVTRNFMKAKGFFEVETPTIETSTGGAEANPFKTHHKDFNLPVYLRISIGELWQKRLMAAGFEKTFEIGRVYRNEGTSTEHTQEFTNMEFYWAYADYEDGMNLSRELYQTIAKEVFKTCEFEARGHKFDLSGKWPKIDYQEEIIKQTGIDILKATKKEIEEKLKKLKIKYDGETRERLIDTLWKYCRRSISGPAFLVNHPKIVSPLAKAKENNPELTERFQILIAGAEIGNGYSELNNPIDQKERFEEQKKLLEAGDEEAMMPDWEFVEMLEYGIPPTCGFGFGERLFAFLVDKPIREVSLFPLVKPKN